MLAVRGRVLFVIGVAALTGCGSGVDDDKAAPAVGSAVSSLGFHQGVDDLHAYGAERGAFGADAAPPTTDAGMPAAAVTGLTAHAELDGVHLAWDAAAAYVVVRRTYGNDAPAGPLDGVAVYEGTGATAAVDAALGGAVAHYRAFARNEGGAFAPGSDEAVAVPVVPFAFSGGTRAYDFYTPAVADVDGDGCVEPLGTRNFPRIGIVALSAADMGVGTLFADGRSPRDARVADFDGDGRVDFLQNSYAPITDTSSTARLFFQSSATPMTFVESEAAQALDMRGYGETELVADFDGDGDLDLFVPYYSYNYDAEHSYLLVNDGAGHFTDVADAAGVALRGIPSDIRPEGAVAYDFDLDGFVDFYVGSHLFRNNHDLTFTDVCANVGLPIAFDEGTKLLDWNDDGWLDLVIHHPYTGPALWQFDGASFTKRDVFPAAAYDDVNGIAAEDVNHDGRIDVVVAGRTASTQMAFLNDGSSFVPVSVPAIEGTENDLPVFADLDGDGASELVRRSFAPVRGLDVFHNTSRVARGSFVGLEIVDAAGRRNQQGHVVRVRPVLHPGVVFTRIVDGGDGYMTQSPYEITLPTPYAEPHEVTVYFAGGTKVFVVMPGEHWQLAADGSGQLLAKPDCSW